MIAVCLRYGSRHESGDPCQGDAVRGVQEEFQFRNLSGDPGKGLQVDGIFGPKTDAAVRGFQQALHQDIPSVTVDC
jgi:peptidoglycan hydrolase-like protein with peptidoglycan-binding domain